MEKTLRGILPDEMLTDYEGIDVEHEEIFSRITALRSAGPEAGSGFIGELTDLVRYLADHFAMEERLAAEAGFDIAAHARSHAENLHLFNKALSEAGNSGMQANMQAYALLRYIEYWFEHHINEFDKSLARRLQTQSGYVHKGAGDRHLVA
jgi:hemerythrin-like metal-binding protein